MMPPSTEPRLSQVRGGRGHVRVRECDHADLYRNGQAKSPIHLYM